jgi:hypothetical protein
MNEPNELKCNQTNCNEIPTRIVYWPGKNPPPKMCLYHAMQALRIMQAFGLDLVCEEIK